MICSRTVRAIETGNREADPLRAAVLRIDRAVDADQIPAGVDQRAAGVARIDGCVGLDEVLEAVDPEMVAPEGAHDAVRDGVAESERVAEREHRVADLDVVERAERDCRQVLALRLEHREVGFGVAAANGGAHPPPVGKHHLDIVGALDHVIVGEHVAFAADDDAGPEAGRAPRSALRQAGKKAPQQRIIEQRTALPHFLARVDVDDRRHGLLRRIGEAFDLRTGNGAARLLDEHHVLPVADPGKQVGPQRRDDEERRQTHGGDLCEE